MLLYPGQQIVGPGKMHSVPMAVLVMDEVLGREKCANGRRLCLGPAEVYEK